MAICLIAGMTEAIIRYARNCPPCLRFSFDWKQAAAKISEFPDCADCGANSAKRWPGFMLSCPQTWLYSVLIGAKNATQAVVGGVIGPYELMRMKFVQNIAQFLKSRIPKESVPNLAL